MTWKHTFTVTGSGQFPIDMLRYDRCCPEREEDSSHIISSLESPVGEHSVQIIKFAENRQWRPTAARWKSFGWDILSASYKAEKL